MKNKTLAELQTDLKTEQLKHEMAQIDRWSLTNETKREVSKFDKAEKKILSALKGWSMQDVECLLIHRVIPSAKRAAKVA